MSIEATKICHFVLKFTGIGSQPARCFKLKKLYNYVRYQVAFFAFIEATKNIILFRVMPQKTLSQSVRMIFFF